MFRKLDTELKSSLEAALDTCTTSGLYNIGFLLSLGSENPIYKEFQSKISLSEKEGEDIKEVIDDKEITNILPSTSIPKNAKINVRLIGNWTTCKILSDLWNKMSKGDNTWNNITLDPDISNPDYYVVINSPPRNEVINAKRTILFRMEPNMEKNPQMWGFWANPDPKYFAKVCFHTDEYNNIEWHLGKTYQELKNMKSFDKTHNLISTVLSDKYKDPGHKKRIDFVKFLDEKDCEIHVYGTNKDYKNYKGSLPYHKKDDAMFPYKYSFNCENNSIENYFTEKLVDGILAGCLVFYSGHPSVKNYIDDKAFVYLELEDFEKDYQTIQKAIKEDWWSQRLPHIMKARNKILDELQFFPRLEKIINNLNTNKNQ